MDWHFRSRLTLGCFKDSNLIVPATTRRPFRGLCWVLVLTSAGCATPSAKVATSESNAPRTDQAKVRSVHAVAVQTPSVEGQTSWIIEPDMPCIPKISGLQPQLAPHIESRLNYAFDLAQCGAVHTAEAEFRAVLGLCALEIDSREGGTRHREALRQGLMALQEADQFAGNQLEKCDAIDVRKTAASHSTPILQHELSPLDSVQATQAYYEFAEQRLVEACQGLQGASLAYYGLARTIVVPEMNMVNASGKAVLLHRVALNIAPQNLLAANELGVLLAQHGQFDAAEKIFRQSLALNPTPDTWKNLAAVYARQGQSEASRAALASSESLAMQPQQNPAAADGGLSNVNHQDPSPASTPENKPPSFIAARKFFGSPR